MIQKLRNRPLKKIKDNNLLLTSYTVLNILLNVFFFCRSFISLRKFLWYMMRLGNAFNKVKKSIAVVVAAKEICDRHT